MCSDRISSPAASSLDPVADPFDTLLNLESNYEARGYADGLSDGRANALTSATLFGVERGFEKFVVLSRLRWRAEQWATTFDVHFQPDAAGADAEDTSIEDRRDSSAADVSKSQNSASVIPHQRVSDRYDDHLARQRETPAGQVQTRLQKHIAMLLALTSARTLDYRNTDGAIGDFEERLKRAQAKAKIIERMVGVEGEGQRHGAMAADTAKRVGADIEETKTV